MIKREYIYIIVISLLLSINFNQYLNNNYDNNLTTVLNNQNEIKQIIKESTKKQETKLNQIKKNNYVEVKNEPIDSVVFWINNFQPRYYTIKD